MIRRKNMPFYEYEDKDKKTAVQKLARAADSE